MKKIVFIFAVFLITSCGAVVLNDDLYVQISAEAVCSSSMDDTVIYNKYGVTEQQMMDYRDEFSKDEQKRQTIATKILQATAVCLER